MDKRQKESLQCSRRLIITRSLQIAGVSSIMNLIPATKVMSQEVLQKSIASKRPTSKDFIQKAFDMKEIAVDSGDQAYGAIVVKNQEIIGLGPSKVIINHDPTAHAEIESIRDACRHLQSNDLTGCVLYSTSKPCRMCETAGYWANISKMYYGVHIADGGSPQYSSC